MQRCMHGSKILGVHGRSTKHDYFWGAESWNLTKTNRDKLSIFHHSAIHYIMEIRMKRAQEEKIQRRYQKDLSQHLNNQYLHHMKNLVIHWKDHQRQTELLPKKTSVCMDTPTSQIGMPITELYKNALPHHPQDSPTGDKQ